MRDYLQLIGQALDVQCPANRHSALLYAEVQDGVNSCSVFFSSTPGEAIYRFPSGTLEDLVYEFWENGQEGVAPRSWAAIEYMLVGAKLEVAFAYNDEFKHNEDEPERRPRVLARRYPGFAVDYSSPRG